jgi:hypothetical protein
MVLGLLFLVLVGREISHGPGEALSAEEGEELTVPDLSALPAEKTDLFLTGREISHVPGDALPAGRGKEPPV